MPVAESQKLVYNIYTVKKRNILLDRLVDAGKILCIDVMDHIIIGDTHYSFKEHGLL